MLVAQLVAIFVLYTASAMGLGAWIALAAPNLVIGMILSVICVLALPALAFGVWLFAPPVPEEEGWAD